MAPDTLAPSLEVLPETVAKARKAEVLAIMDKFVFDMHTKSGLLGLSGMSNDMRTLDTAARALPRGSFAAALVPWDADRVSQKSWTASAVAQAVDRFTDLVRVRQSFYEELQKAVS